MSNIEKREKKKNNYFSFFLYLFLFIYQFTINAFPFLYCFYELANVLISIIHFMYLDSFFNRNTAINTLKNTLIVNWRGDKLINKTELAGTNRIPPDLPESEDKDK